MQTSQEFSKATSDDIRDEVCRCLDQWIRAVHRGRCTLDKLPDLRDLIDALPLSSGDYCTAVNRISNAKRYLESNERGAARYELKLLDSSLRQFELRKSFHQSARSLPPGPGV